MINEDPDLPVISLSTTRRLMLDLGFAFEKRNRRSLLIERNDIVLWRRKYLCEIKKYREGKKIYYLDETWCNAGHTTKQAWTPSYIKSAKQSYMIGETTGLKNIPGRGGRYIVVHIGNEDGFLRYPNDLNETNDALWVYRAKKKQQTSIMRHITMR